MDVSPPTGDVYPRARTLWGGTAQGITGIHEWTFTDMTQGVLVATNELRMEPATAARQFNSTTPVPPGGKLPRRHSSRWPKT